MTRPILSFLLAWGILVSLVTAACERGFMEVLTYKNQTDMVVHVYRKYTDTDLFGLALTLQPHEIKETVGTIGYPKLFFEARDSSNRMIFSLTTTPAALKENGWRIVITDQRQMPNPSPVTGLLSAPISGPRPSHVSLP